MSVVEKYVRRAKNVCVKMFVWIHRFTHLVLQRFPSLQFCLHICFRQIKWNELDMWTQVQIVRLVVDIGQTKIPVERTQFFPPSWILAAILDLTFPDKICLGQEQLNLKYHAIPILIYFL